MAEKTLQGLLFAFVSDGAGGEDMIRTGDRFDLIPAERRERDKDRPIWMRQLFGAGPYVVSRIAYNPVKGFMGASILFCKRPDGSEPGAFASEFQKT